MNLAGAGWLPIAVAPLGVVTWFAPGGPAAALPASWLAVICDPRPQLRAGCGGCGLDAGQFPTGTDFVVNVPVDQDAANLHVLTQRLRAGEPLSSIVAADPIAARTVHAPLLTGCTLHIECAHGCLVPGAWETELAGDLLVLHRGGLTLDPAAVGDFCALWPLRASLPV